MKRRGVLSGGTTAVLGCLAGCVGGTDESDDATGGDATSSVDGEQPPSDGDFWLSRDELPRLAEPTVVDFETASLTAAAVGRQSRTDDGFAVTMDLRSGATASSPARLVATVVNTRPFAQPLELRRLDLLDSPSLATARQQDRNTMYIVPTETHPLARRVPGYQRDTEGRWRLTEIGDDWYPQRITFDAETGFVADYYLLGHHFSDEPPVGPGRYQLGGRDQPAIVTWSTAEPGPDETPALAGRDPPPLPGEQSTAWYHDATPETTLYLQPDTERVQPPDRISFEHVNHSRQSLGGNPYSWRLYKLADGEWLPVAPWSWEQPASRLVPGGRAESELGVFHGKTATTDDRTVGTRAVGYLGGGLYAYTGGFDTEDEKYAALFEFDAPELDIGIESTAEIIESGSRMVIELPNHAEARRPATFQVSKTDSDPERQLIAEQLPRRPFRGLRNSLPLFEEGVESVHVKTDRGTALQLADYEENKEIVVRYQGVAYSAVGVLDE